MIVSNEQFSEPNKQRSETIRINFKIPNERSETILASPVNTTHHSRLTDLVLNASPIVSSKLFLNS